jgi:hypothetical protein
MDSFERGDIPNTLNDAKDDFRWKIYLPSEHWKKSVSEVLESNKKSVRPIFRIHLAYISPPLTYQIKVLNKSLSSVV